MLGTENKNKKIFLYCLMGTMLVKEIYIYVACVLRADKKINKEKFDKSLAAGFANLLKSAKTRLLKDWGYYLMAITKPEFC